MAHGTDTQKNAFAHPQMEGRYFGTMCLSEPGAGSSLGDLTTKAVPDGQGYADCPLGPRYRIKGSKMWISGAEHDLSENIVHLRSEEHTSELQSLMRISYAVFCLKKKNHI